MKSETRRSSGMTVASENAQEVVQEIERGIDEAVLPEERQKDLRTPGFSRMRFDWRGEDRSIIQQARATADGAIVREFEDAYEVMSMIYDEVRTPEADEAGNPKRDQFGYIVWQRNVGGGYDEDFTRLTLKQKQHYLFLITTRLFEWEQRSADLWGEAMMAKAQWEERFSIGFDKGMSGTEADRRAAGNLDARDERYYAIYMTWMSRKAEAIVRSMSLLGQRLKDSLES